MVSSRPSSSSELSLPRDSPDSKFTCSGLRDPPVTYHYHSLLLSSSLSLLIYHFQQHYYYHHSSLIYLVSPKAWLIIMMRMIIIVMMFYLISPLTGLPRGCRVEDCRGSVGWHWQRAESRLSQPSALRGELLNNVGTSIML